MHAVAADLYIVDSHLKHPFRWGDQPGKVELKSKWTKHGFQEKALNNRVAEVSSDPGDVNWNGPRGTLRTQQPAPACIHTIIDHIDWNRWTGS
jgi:hypothetical protein